MKKKQVITDSNQPVTGSFEYCQLQKAKEVLKQPNTVLIHGMSLAKAREIVNRYR